MIAAGKGISWPLAAVIGGPCFTTAVLRGGATSRGPRSRGRPGVRINTKPSWPSVMPEGARPILSAPLESWSVLSCSSGLIVSPLAVGACHWARTQWQCGRAAQGARDRARMFPTWRPLPAAGPKRHSAVIRGAHTACECPSRPPAGSPGRVVCRMRPPLSDRETCEPKQAKAPMPAGRPAQRGRHGPPFEGGRCAIAKPSCSRTSHKPSGTRIARLDNRRKLF
jgi:hypothetical protein